NSAKECREVYDELIGIAKKAIGQDKKWDIILPMSLTSQLGYGPATPI
ncbi:putative siderophore biosynthesis lipase/esterase, partial [Seiridium unicorne]